MFRVWKIMVTRRVVPRWNVEKIDGNFIRDKVGQWISMRQKKTKAGSEASVEEARGTGVKTVTQSASLWYLVICEVCWIRGSDCSGPFLFCCSTVLRQFWFQRQFAFVRRRKTVIMKWCSEHLVLDTVSLVLQSWENSGSLGCIQVYSQIFSVCEEVHRSLLVI